MNTTVVEPETLLRALMWFVVPAVLLGIIVTAFVVAGRQTSTFRPPAYSGCWSGLFVCGLWVVATAGTSSGILSGFSGLLGSGEWIAGGLVGLVAGVALSYVDGRLTGDASAPAGVAAPPKDTDDTPAIRYRRSIGIWAGHAAVVTGAGLGLLILFGSPVLRTFVVAATLSGCLGWLIGRLADAGRRGSPSGPGSGRRPVQETGEGG